MHTSIIWTRLLAGQVREQPTDLENYVKALQKVGSIAEVDIFTNQKDTTSMNGRN